jgi:glycerophosphoryl diester phosphodiesterase
MAKTETKPIEWVVMGGAGKLAPENTMSALNEGLVRGVDYVWLDLQVSRDGVPFLFRDKRLERTTNARGIAHALDWKHLKQLDASDGHHAAAGPERIPALTEVLDWLQSADIRMILEIRATDRMLTSLLPALAKACQQMPRASEKLSFASGSTTALVGCGEVLKGKKRLLIVDKPKRPILLSAQEMGLGSVGCTAMNWTEKRVRNAGEYDLEATAFAIRNYNDAKRLIKVGVKRLCIDDIDIKHCFDGSMS